MERLLEVLTFDEFVEYGKRVGGNIVNGMPWSFNFKGHPVTHENDDMYLVCLHPHTVKFRRDEVLIIERFSRVFTCKRVDFEKVYGTIL